MSTDAVHMSTVSKRESEKSSAVISWWKSCSRSASTASTASSMENADDAKMALQQHISKSYMCWRLRRSTAKVLKKVMSQARIFNSLRSRRRVRMFRSLYIDMSPVKR